MSVAAANGKELFGRTASFDTNLTTAILAGLVRMNQNLHVAVVGATGAVGIEMIKTLEKRNFPVGKLTLLASARSVGKKLKFRGETISVQELTADSFTGIDVALFSAGGSISKEFAPLAARSNCVV